jgi:hypothetical protein
MFSIQVGFLGEALTIYPIVDFLSVFSAPSTNIPSVKEWARFDNYELVLLCD